MSKFTLFTFQSKKDELLKKLQIYKNIHFKNLANDELYALDFLKKDYSNEQYNFYTEELGKLKFITEKLKPLKPKEKGLASLTKENVSLSYDEFEKFSMNYDYESIFQKIKAIDENVKNLKQKCSKLETDNFSYQQWIRLDVSTKQLSDLKFSTFVLGNVNKANYNTFSENFRNTFKNFYFENLGDSKDDSHVLIIYEKSDSENVMSFLRDNGFSKMPIELSDIPEELIKTNTSEINKLKSEIAALEEGNKQFLKEYDNILILTDYYESMLERTKISERFVKTNDVLVLEGWVPEGDMGEFGNILNKVCGNEYFIEFEKVDFDSTEVPIKLKNNKLVSAFENVTAMFNMPKYNEIDPTPLLTPFYILFFGIMVGDLGYGLVLFIATFAALKFFTLGEGTRNFMKFLCYCSLGVIAAGIVFGGAFGIKVFAPITYVDPATGQTVKKAIIDSDYQIVLMMIISVALGFFQIIFGLLVKGYMNIRDGKFIDAVFDSFFYITTLFSAVLLLLGATGVVPASVAGISKWVLIISIFGLLFTQGRMNKTMVGKVAGGAYAVYGLSSYVGDFVSYTRLVALSLSGAYVALSFNKMIELLPAGIVRIIFGVLIFLASQTLNIGLSVLGAYVHSCRLQYVEYFGKFYEGGGVPFRPFGLKNKFITLKE